MTPTTTRPDLIDALPFARMAEWYISSSDRFQPGGAGGYQTVRIAEPDTGIEPLTCSAEPDHPVSVRHEPIVAHLALTASQPA